MSLRNFIVLILFLSCATSLFAQDYYSKKDVLDAKEHAFALYNVSKNDDALEILEKIPKKYLTEDIYIVKANIYEDKKDLKNAYNNLNLALQINPNSYKAYYNLGLLAYKENNIELAKNNFNKSIKIKSDFSYSHYNLALCYIKENSYKHAKKELIRAIELKPDKNFYYNLAYVYKKLNKERDAKKVLDTYNQMD